jgi:hypothetical protein
MTITNRLASRFTGGLVGALVAALALWVAIPGAVLAEPAENTRTAPAGAAAAPPAQAAATTLRAAGSQRVPGRATQGRPWSIEDALPDKSSALNSSTTTPPPAQLGRIPWQNGTLGVETKSQVDPYELPDGRRIPGLESSTHNKPSYLGLSLSVPSHDKLFQVPALPSFGSAVGRPQ